MSEERVVDEEIESYKRQVGYWRGVAGKQRERADGLMAAYKVESEKMKAFCATATAEEGWCHWCGDYSADEEAPALTRLRAEVVRLTALVESAEQKAADYLAEIEAAHAERDRLVRTVDQMRGVR